MNERNQTCDFRRVSQHRRAFTLLELVAAVGVIAVLLALILPAVQAARESARRAQCLNNLRQVGIALNAYSSVHQYYPGINTQTLSPTSFSGQSLSVLTRMLDHLEHRNLFNGINMSWIITDDRILAFNHTVMTIRIEMFVCPSDPSSPPEGYGRCNYQFSIGPTPWHAPGPMKPDSLAGPFSVHMFYRPSDFRDGLSQTVGMSERSQGDWISDDLNPGDYALTPIEATITDYAADWTGACADVAKHVGVESRGGESWFLSGLHFTNYNHCQGPNAKLMDCSFSGSSGSVHHRTIINGVMSARSYHPGGVHAGRMDGSVQWVSDSIALPIWRALSTRSGGEAVSSF